VSAALATAYANIALAKYWGKADAESNQPAVPSISMTLGELKTTTEVRFEPNLKEDRLTLNGEQSSGRPLERAGAMLERVRTEAALPMFARVTSDNNFPTAAGLASSASGFAALALAARCAAGLGTDLAAASALARQSSASAARSVYGEYVALDLGASCARRVELPRPFPLELIVAVTQEGPKDVGSTEGMQLTQRTSPYYPAWVAQAPEHARKTEDALRSADLRTLGPLVEHSALLMHASMWGAVPPLIYFTGATLAVVAGVRQLQQEGTPAYFTMDAGPHVKVITTAEHADLVRTRLAQLDGVLKTIHCRLGPDATVEQLR
jgi:diphosphomevalonate decarboxylase